MLTDSRPSRRRFLVLAATAASLSVAAIAVPGIARAYDDRATTALNVDAKGIALKGFDPVSYRSPNGPAQGKPELSAKHEGATYLFATAANRDAFKADPGKYAPAFGGFCAMGVALNKKLDVDPQLWRIVDGKLYLNVHKGAQTRWLEDPKGNIAKAAANWPDIKNKAPNAL